MYGTPIFATDLSELEETTPHLPVGFDIRSSLRSAIAQVHVPSTPDVVHTTHPDVQGLISVLQKWKRELKKPKPTPTYLAFVLDESYGDEPRLTVDDPGTGEDFRLCDLRGLASYQTRALQEACDATGSTLYLSELVRTIEEEEEYEGDDMDYCDEYAFEERDVYHVRVPAYELTGTRDLEGAEVTPLLSITVEDLVQNDYFSEEYYGPEDDGTVDVIIIAPDRPALMETFLGTGMNHNKEVLSYLHQKMQDKPSDPAYRVDLVTLCEKVIEKQEMSMRSNQSKSSTYISLYGPIRSVIKLCAELGEIELLQRALLCFEAGAPKDLFTELGQMLGIVPFDVMVEGLQTCIDPIKSFEGRFEAMRQLFGTDFESKEAMEKRMNTSLGQWFVSKMEELLTPKKILVKSARMPLMRFAELHDVDTYILERICPLLEKSSDMSPFVISFLNFIGKANLIRDSTVATVFRRVVPILTEHFNLALWMRNAFYDYGDKSIHLYTLKSYASQRQLAPIDGRDLGEFLDACFTFGLHAEVGLILEKLVTESQSFDRPMLEAVTLACLARLIFALVQHHIFLGSSEYSHLYQHILGDYVDAHVGVEPAKPSKSWIRRPVTCSYPQQCSDCNELNQFLRNPNESVWEWQLFKTRHRHIEQGLRYGKSDCNVRTARKGVNGPYVVVLTKSTDSYDSAFSAWDRKRKHARSVLATFDKDALKSLLGERFEEIVQLKAREPLNDHGPAPRISSRPAGLMNLQNQPHPVPPLHSIRGNVIWPSASPTSSSQVQSLKRNQSVSNIVDLTEDDPPSPKRIRGENERY
ncbi:hypothetical protein P153DRAFT_398173 [Dothidotthia symphoricarpi CBS 119687]|uniref:Uncharacterized protein n=1 Tax=Dothidotthia symphoricarpi CBS 119687 TaxID=1392245 RepID=A0A6A6A6P6_9PLEO|nr:uncharacterized protein P153DRAFT_398173 [Dothidotthia symphoricarpi CBS 119687]KAF2127559.1 hypothetical protein P153DRAFT_398173 [Dothidotthia symphoricarpi CBS 119687]